MALTYNCQFNSASRERQGGSKKGEEKDRNKLPAATKTTYLALEIEVKCFKIIL